MFTRKHSESIARILSFYHKDISELAWRSLVSEFAHFLKQDNPRFDKGKFIIACEKDYS